VKPEDRFFGKNPPCPEKGGGLMAAPANQAVEKKVFEKQRVSHHRKSTRPLQPPWGEDKNSSNTPTTSHKRPSSPPQTGKKISGFPGRG